MDGRTIEPTDARATPPAPRAPRTPDRQSAANLPAFPSRRRRPVLPARETLRRSSLRSPERGRSQRGSRTSMPNRESAATRDDHLLALGDSLLVSLACPFGFGLAK